MLTAIVSFSLRHRGIVVALACVLLGYGVDPLGTTPKEFTDQIAKDIPAWAEAIKISGAKIE